jgi:hypothetical protein
MESFASVIIPLHNCVLFVRSLDCAEFSSQPAKIAAAFHAISGGQIMVGGRRIDECWPPGTVRIGRSSAVWQRWLWSFA